MASRLRPRTTSELLDALFELLRHHYLSFLTIVAAGFAPAAALGAVTGLAGGFGAFNAFGGSGDPRWTGTLVALLVVFAVVVLASVALVQGAVIYAASDAYLDDRIDVASALRRSASNVPMLLIAFLLTGLSTLVGYVFLIVPGIYIAAGLFAVPAIVLLEGRGPSEAMERSMSLTKGRKLAVLGALFVTALIAGVMRASLGAVGSIGFGPSVGMAAQIAAYTALYPLTTIMGVLLYYDARIRFEGFDLERAAAALDPATPPPTPAA
ncbi:MAG TPA: hypothetical protein VFJ74_14430 [Gemmatimonadaceae bacterium]|nr:hypothetical protein [Gemmatimonadaceae bacterium]